MTPVDPQRILIAIYDSKTQLVKEMFTYTSSARLTVTPRLSNVPAAVQFKESLLITPQQHDARRIHFAAPGEPLGDPADLRFDTTRYLCHYVPSASIRIKEVQDAKKTADCSQAPRACVLIADQYVPFSC